MVKSIVVELKLPEAAMLLRRGKFHLFIPRLKPGERIKLWTRRIIAPHIILMRTTRRDPFEMSTVLSFLRASLHLEMIGVYTVWHGDIAKISHSMWGCSGDTPDQCESRLADREKDYTADKYHSGSSIRHMKMESLSYLTISLLLDLSIYEMLALAYICIDLIAIEIEIDSREVNSNASPALVFNLQVF